jgi:di/tricarboxylate transporter
VPEHQSAATLLTAALATARTATAALSLDPRALAASCASSSASLSRTLAATATSARSTAYFTTNELSTAHADASLAAAILAAFPPLHLYEVLAYLDLFLSRTPVDDRVWNDRFDPRIRLLSLLCVRLLS